MNRSRIPFLLAVLFFGISARAFINVESVRQRPGSGFLGSSSFKLSGQRGNTDKLTTNLATLNILRGRRDEMLFLGNYNYGYSNDTRDTNNAQLHLRYVFMSRAPNAYEVFLQTEFDEFKNLNSRNLGGANWRARLARSLETSLFFGLGGFYETEDYKKFAHRRGVRANVYVSLVKKLDDLLTSSATLYYQPRFSDLSDFRIRGQADLDLNLTKKLLWNLEFSLSHDSWVPQPSIIKTDMTYLTGLTLQY